MGELKLNSESSLKTEYEEWMTSKEAAAYLRIGIHSLMNMASNGQIKYYKLGRRNRYRLSDLKQLLMANARGGVYVYPKIVNHHLLESGITQNVLSGRVLRVCLGTPLHTACSQFGFWSHRFEPCHTSPSSWALVLL